MPAEFSLADGVVVQFYVPSSQIVSVLPQGTPISGEDGTDGTDGKSVLNGTGAPSNLNGNNGDFYIDTAALVIYGPKAAGAWPGSGTSLIGPEGPAGAGGAHPIMLMGG